MACLITGLGYVGSALARRLLALGEHVIGIENFFSTPREPIDRLAGAGKFTLVEGSIADPATLERALGLAEVDTVFHLAAQASTHPGAAALEYTERANFVGARLVLEACAARGVGCVLVASSTRLYAAPLPRHLSEGAPLRPTDPVHLSHLYAEILLNSLRQQHPGATFAALRLGTVHGVGPVMKVDPRFLAAPQRFCLQAARGELLEVSAGPSSLLALVHLDDAVAAFLHCRDHPPAATVVNVATEVRSAFEIAHAVGAAAALRGIDVPSRILGRPRGYAPRRVSSALDASGFRPTRRLEDSVDEVLDYYLAHPPDPLRGGAPPGLDARGSPDAALRADL